jgi:hypothetical protein
MITVYFGTLAGSVANVINGRAGPQGAAKLGLVAAGGALMVLGALYAAYVTRCETLRLKTWRDSPCAVFRRTGQRPRGDSVCC